jgi:2-methylcitrate dehydratase PrpD
LGVTEKLARFVVEFPGEQIPDSILHQEKRCFINFLAVALYASRDPSVDILLDLIREEGGKHRASVVGRNLRTTLQNAALVNGYLGHHQDYDDTHFPTVIHPSSPIFPGTLSVAEDQGASGRDFLVASALGIEAACRIGSVIAPNFREAASFWHITGTCGVFGAAAAAGRLLHLNSGTMVHALGIAGTQASGIREVFGSMCKPFHAGHAAQSGVLAALLAKRGFTSTEAILEGKRGFVAVMATGYDLDKSMADLGERWELPLIGLKPYACGLANHALVDVMFALRSKEGVTPENVESISGSVRALAPALATRRHPTTGLEGKFSYHHSMAAVLVDGAAFPAQYTDAKVRDPLITSLRDRISVTADPTLEGHAAVATVVLKDGRSYKETVPYPTGSPERPMTDAQVEAKFRSLAREALSKERVERLVEQLWELEKVADMRNVTTLIRSARAGRSK